MFVFLTSDMFGPGLRISHWPTMLIWLYFRDIFKAVKIDFTIIVAELAVNTLMINAQFRRIQKSHKNAISP